jgi:hypothetical protein
MQRLCTPNPVRGPRYGPGRRTYRNTVMFPQSYAHGMPVLSTVIA